MTSQQRHNLKQKVLNATKINLTACFSRFSRNSFWNVARHVLDEMPTGAT